MLRLENFGGIAGVKEALSGAIEKARKVFAAIKRRGDDGAGVAHAPVSHLLPL